MLHSSAPGALNPPTTTVPLRAPTIHATRGPATKTGLMPGMAKKTAPNNVPQSPPQKAPDLPQNFMRPPVLQYPYHEFVGMLIL